MELKHERDFYCHVTSVPSNSFPENECSSFSVDLGEPVIIDTDDVWEVGLTYLCYPFAWNTLEPNKDYFVQYMSTDDTAAPRRFAGRMSDRSHLHPGTYTSVKDIVDNLNSMRPTLRTRDGNIRDVKAVLEYRHLPGTNRIKIHFAGLQDEKEGLMIKMSEPLADLCRFTAAASNKWHTLNPEVPVVSLSMVTMPRYISEINLGCSLVDMEATCTGNVWRGLFSTTEINPPDDRGIMQSVTPQVLAYKKIARCGDIRRMMFEMVDQDGKNIDLTEIIPVAERMEYHSNVHAGIHFRRRKKN